MFAVVVRKARTSRPLVVARLQRLLLGCTRSLAQGRGSTTGKRDSVTVHFNEQSSVSFTVGKMARHAQGSAVTKHDNTLLLTAVLAQANEDVPSFINSSPAFSFQLREPPAAFGFGSFSSNTGTTSADSSNTGRSSTPLGKGSTGPGPGSGSGVTTKTSGGPVSSSPTGSTSGSGSGSSVAKDLLLADIVDTIFKPRIYSTNNVQVHSRVLAGDGEADIFPVNINSISAALVHSGIDWAGPVACVRVGANRAGSIIVNPRAQVVGSLAWSILYVGDRNGAVFFSLERNPFTAARQESDATATTAAASSGGDDNASESGSDSAFSRVLDDALDIAQRHVMKIIAELDQLRSRRGDELLPPPVVPSLNKTLSITAGRYAEQAAHNTVRQFEQSLTGIQSGQQQQQQGQGKAAPQLHDFMETLFSYMPELRRLFPMQTPSKLQDVLSQALMRELTALYLRHPRLDGRSPTDVRTLTTELDLMPTLNGSAYTTLGATESLTRANIDHNAFTASQGLASRRGFGVNAMIVSPAFSTAHVALSHASNHSAGSTQYHRLEALFLETALRACSRSFILSPPVKLTTDILSMDGGIITSAFVSAFFAITVSRITVEQAVGACTVCGIVDPLHTANTVVLTDPTYLEELASGFVVHGASVGGDLFCTTMTSRIGGIPIHALKPAIDQLRAGSVAVEASVRHEMMVSDLAKHASVTMPLTPGSSITKTIQLSANDILRCIGKGGQNIQMIETVSKCRVVADRATGEVRITGERESDLTRAEEMIRRATAPTLHRRMAEFMDQQQRLKRQESSQQGEERPSQPDGNLASAEIPPLQEEETPAHSTTHEGITEHHHPLAPPADSSKS